MEKQVKVRNKSYSLSHSSVCSLNLIGVSNGEFGCYGKMTHMEAETTLFDVNMKNHCFHFQGFDHFQA